jgi:hypothetical protein
MTVDKTLDERGARYGKFVDHARIAQGLQDIMRNEANWNSLRPNAKQALTVIADKIARILNGDPDYEDNWHDIQGYAKLVEDDIKLRKQPKETQYNYEDGPNMPPVALMDIKPRLNGGMTVDESKAFQSKTLANAAAALRFRDNEQLAYIKADMEEQQRRDVAWEQRRSYENPSIS